MPADREESAEKLLGLMEEHAVERATLVQIGGTALETHAYLRHCLKRYPDRFKGIGLVPDPRRPEDHMDRLAEDGGIVGFRLHEIGGPLDPTAPMDVRTFTTYPFWKHAAARDYIVWLYPRAADAHLTPWLLDAFPELTVVFNHLMICPAPGSMATDDQGRPRMVRRTFSFDMPLTRHNTLGSRSSRTCASSCPASTPSAGSPTRTWTLRRWHEQLVKDMGADHCMWATDFPWIQEDPGYGKLTRVLDEAAAGYRRGGPRADHGRHRAPHGLARIGGATPLGAEVTSLGLVRTQSTSRRRRRTSTPHSSLKRQRQPGRYR